MSHSGIFRKLTAEDWPKFNELASEAFWDDYESHENFLRHCEEPYFIGYFANNELLGYILFRIFENNTGHINSIASHKKVRGQGIGSKLMEYILQTMGDVDQVALYVETKNETAIGLYRKFDFKVEVETWHYIIPVEKFEQHKEILDRDLEFREVEVKDIANLEPVFQSVNYADHKRQMADPKNTNRFLALFENNNPVCYTRFNPSFSGCMPFVFADLKYVDTFLNHIMVLRQKDKDYLRFTYEKNNDLTKVNQKRDYSLHHHLYKMVRKN